MRSISGVCSIAVSTCHAASTKRSSSLPHIPNPTSTPRLRRRMKYFDCYNEGMGRNKKIRADFRKEHQVRRRQKDLTRDFSRDEDAADKLHKSERLTGKGELTRKRTVVGQESDPAAAG